VHVKNIPFAATEQEIHDAFAVHGSIMDVYLPKDVHTRSRKGFGFIEFGDADAAGVAVDKMDGVSMHGQTLTVEMAKNQRRSRGEMLDQDRRGGGGGDRDRRGGGGGGRRDRSPPRRRRRDSRSPSPPRRDRRDDRRDERRGRSPPPPSRRTRDRSPRN
jgi:RNA recognition motif-containing protein